jgi:hypothetical protein
MSVEIIWLGPAEPSVDHRARCRHCARILTAFPTDPTEMAPHCSARGCRDCVECIAGANFVSPRGRHLRPPHPLDGYQPGRWAA